MEAVIQSLDINYDYSAAGKTARVFINQTQQIKSLSFLSQQMFIRVRINNGTKYGLNTRLIRFVFHTVSKPDLINVDGDKVLLCEKTEHKTLDNYIFQYKNAGLFVDRREAIDYAARSQSDDPKALDLMKTALKDKYYGLRIYTLQKLYLQNDSVKKLFEPVLADMAVNDPKTLVRARAIEALGRYKKDLYKPLFLKSINDSSYSVAGTCLMR